MRSPATIRVRERRWPRPARSLVFFPWSGETPSAGPTDHGPPDGALHDAPEEGPPRAGGGEGGVQHGDGVSDRSGSAAAVGEEEGAGAEEAGPAGGDLRGGDRTAAGGEPGAAGGGAVRGDDAPASGASPRSSADGRAAGAGVEGEARAGAGDHLPAEARAGAAGGCRTSPTPGRWG